MAGNLIWLFAGLVLGVLAGFAAWYLIIARRTHLAERTAAQIITEAQTEQKELLLEAKEEAIRIRDEAEAENRQRRSELQRQERRLSQKEENLGRKSESLERREHTLSQKEKQIEDTRAQLDEFRKRELRQLELISGMSSAEARDYLLKKVEEEVRDDLTRRVSDLEAQAKAEGDQRARQIVALAIQRCATDVVSETTVSVVSLPSDDMKGRLIGREGRNIRALENATGVDLIVDDTPETVTLSCFDPVRREIARLALEKLIVDGRIHPARIEEIVDKTRSEVEAAIQTEGERAAYEAGVPGLHLELIKLLGRLKWRTSYGQNVLTHSLEVCHIANVIAAELGADVDTCKAAGLLHDIGKAVDHEVEGPHAQIGADLAKKAGRSPQVVQAIAGHHGEADGGSVEGFIVSAADAISSSRPGARRESVEQYLKRLEALENIANAFPGVEKSFAIQAGREVRILVKPQEIDDLAATRLAHDIVAKVEQSLDYPGQIKIMVIRETRAVDYAK